MEETPTDCRDVFVTFGSSEEIIRSLLQQKASEMTGQQRVGMLNSERT